MSDKYLNDYVEGSLGKMCWNFCANCEMPIFSAEKYRMYEGLCKKCYYRKVYQEDMTPEQIDWIQPKEDEDTVTINIPGCEPLKCSVDDIVIIDSHPEYECKRPMFAQFKQAIDAKLREKYMDSNER